VASVVSYSGSDGDEQGWAFDHWQPGASVARISWLDGYGARHERVCLDEGSALDLLRSIRCDPLAQVIACEVS
jgi:hypothetical protein